MPSELLLQWIGNGNCTYLLVVGIQYISGQTDSISANDLQDHLAYIPGDLGNLSRRISSEAVTFSIKINKDFNHNIKEPQANDCLQS